MGIDANSSGGHAIPPNLPRASSLGNFQSKWSKQMPLYEPAENPRTKTFQWVWACGRVLRYRVLPAPMRRSISKETEVVQLRCGSLRCEGAMWDFSNMSIAISLLASAFIQVAAGNRLSRSSSHPVEELMHGFSETKRNHVSCPFHRVVQFLFRCG